MSIRAYGNNAAIELFEHHLVITRRKPGMIVDGPPAEHFLPYSSIKSVQFERPGFFSVGKIVFVAGNGSSKQGTLSDPHTVVFPKGQVRQFEDVLHTVRQAIATPSIERIATAAAQNRRRIEQSAPPATAAQQAVIVAQPDVQREHDGQAYDRMASHDDRSFTPQPRAEHRPINPKLGGWWSDMPLLGKIIAVGLGCFLLLAMCSVPSPEEDTVATFSNDSTAPSSQQALSELTEFITGRPGSSDIAITDGSGKVGEFCSSSDGATVLSFGGTNVDGQETGVYDYFYAYKSADGGTSTSGTFTFDRAAGRIVITGVKESPKGSKAEKSLPDMSFNVSQISPGVIDVSGVTFHSCII